MKQNKMKNFLNKLVATVLTISLSCSYGIVSKKEVKADNGLIPTAYDNLNVSLRKKSQLVIWRMDICVFFIMKKTLE